MPPTTSIFLHYQQKLTTPPCTSLPPPELAQLEALCGTEHRSFVPPIGLNRPDVDNRSYPVLQKKKSLSSGSRSTASSKVTNHYGNRSIRSPWPTASMYLVRLVRTHIYDFSFMAFGPNPMSYRSYLWPREKYGWSAGHIYIWVSQTL